MRSAYHFTKCFIVALLIYGAASRIIDWYQQPTEDEIRKAHETKVLKDWKDQQDSVWAQLIRRRTEIIREYQGKSR